jgi:NNP family nitrate/nitrite transporter-like MFS transporter
MSLPVIRKRPIDAWDPEDAVFWDTQGKAIANRNMWTSVLVEHIGFCVWSLWSVLVLFMSPKTGFHLSPADKFLLASIVTLVGSVVRPLYGYAVTRLGGRTWTTLSAVFLLVPVAAATVLMGYPHAPFGAFAGCAAVSGIGGGSFASSTTNINFFFPERDKGRALGINAGAGNLGVATVQLLGLLVIATAGIGRPRILAGVFIPLLLIAVVLAATRMDDLPGMRTSGTVYGNALKDPYCWTVSLLYIGTFGSFIGYSFAFGLVLQNDFGRTPLQAASLTFIGPLLGSLIRPVGGWLADRAGAARITLVSFSGLAVGTAVTIAASAMKSLPLFLAAFAALFILSGLGNGSTYAMIPVPYKAAAESAIAAGADPQPARLAARRRAGAVIAIAGTFGGLGGVAINLAFRQAYATAHNARPALIGFLVFYAVCVAVTRYARRRATAPVPVPAEPAAALTGLPAAD